jgi:hypothetical protein
MAEAARAGDKAAAFHLEGLVGALGIAEKFKCETLVRNKSKITWHPAQANIRIAVVDHRDSVCGQMVAHCREICGVMEFPAE